VTETTTTEQRDPAVQEMAPDAPVVAPDDPAILTRTQTTARLEQASATGTTAAPATNSEGNAPLFDQAATGDYRMRWGTVQGSFVDEPRSAVEQADALVADVLKRLTDTFAAERKSLETQWSRGDDISTEELRLALRRYRSFFDRLLSI
jgi:hypothetical protein